MHRIIFCISVFLLGHELVFAQEPEVALHRLLQTSDGSNVRAQIELLKSSYRGTAFAFYLDALAETDAERAYEKYQNLIRQHRNSRYAGSALFRIAQFHFSRGLYISARREFLEFVDKYPRSPFIHEARYFALSCLCATQRDESCYDELKTFLIENSHSPYARLAKEDLNSLRMIVKSSQRSNGGTMSSQGEYTVQIGAFGQINNALNLKSFCRDLGLPADIREANINGKTRYLVWLGYFETEQSALTFGKKFKEEHGKPFRVVKRK
ncbi:MAG: SPOR domain-containing protein [bacterium]